MARINEKAMSAALEALCAAEAPNATATALEYGVKSRTLRERYAKLKEASPPEYMNDGLSGDIAPDTSEIPVFRRTFDTGEHFIYPLGDVHKGAKAHQKEKWRNWLSYLASAQNVSMMGTGDFLNCALKDSKSDVYEEELGVGEAKREIASELEPLAEQDKLDILIPGNHEERVHRATGECPVQDIAWKLGVNYSRTVAVLVYEIGDVSYTGFVLHGKGGGQVGARANRLKKQAGSIATDFYVSGHTHSQLVFPDEYFSVDTKGLRVVRNKQVFVSSGSFLGMEDYAAVAGFSPTHIGAPRIRLDGRKKDVRVSI